MPRTLTTPSADDRRCLDDETVAALLDGKLGPAAANSVAKHIDQCAACRSIVTEVARAADPARLGISSTLNPPRESGGAIRESKEATAREGEGLSGDALDESLLPPGEVVGRYVVRECIGAGAMGVVYMAHDPELERRVALKLLRSDAAGSLSSGARGRLLREAQAIAQLSHPNVIAIYDVGTFRDGVFLAMELVDGGTLTEWLRTPRSWSEVVEVFLGAGEGLAAAHEVGLVHRDFKPDNVLMGKDGRVRVTDFGLARAVGDSQVPAGSPVSLPEQLVASMTRTGTVVGTPAYMAPEQLAGRPADSRSDLFSFCVALHEALYGQRPFAGSTLVGLSQAIARGEVQPPPAGARVPGWLRQLVVRGLVADPQKRPASVRALLDAVEARLPRKRKGPAGILGAAIVASAVAAVATVAAVWTSGHRPGAPAAGGPTLSTATTELPPPASSNGEAIRAYQSALHRFRDGEGILPAVADLTRALELDPDLAAAHLRWALLQFYRYPQEAREHLERAVSRRHALSERDRLLLGAAQAWIQTQPSDAAEYARRMREAVARFPADAELAYFAAEAEAERGDSAASIALAEKAIALDPEFAPPYVARSEDLAGDGDLEGALTAVRDCWARVPTATACLEFQNSLDAQEGNCQRILENSQRLQARDPSDDSPYYWLATAQYALGQPKEAVAELFKQRVSRLPPPLRPRFELWHLWALDVLSGDFDAARGRALDLERSATSNADQRLHARSTVWWNAASIESGRPHDAESATVAYLRKKAAWAMEPRADDWTFSRDPTPALLRVERDLGLLTADAFEAQRASWVDAWSDKVSAQTRPFVWLHGYAATSETSNDAQLALAEQPKFGPIPRFTPWAPGAAYVGTMYFLAGRTSDALPFLRRAARSCLATEFPFEHTQVHLLLGQALASSGERDEACAAYGVVLRRWGNAKPRSITAAKARSLAHQLGCP